MKKLKTLIPVLLIIIMALTGVYLYYWVNKTSVALIGAWKNVKSGSILNFYKDGTFTETGEIPVSGTIKFIDTNKIKATYDGVGSLFGVGPIVMDIQLADNHLIITSPYNTKEEYNKVPDSSFDDSVRNMFSNNGGIVLRR